MSVYIVLCCTIYECVYAMSKISWIYFRSILQKKNLVCQFSVFLSFSFFGFYCLPLSLSLAVCILLFLSFSYFTVTHKRRRLAHYTLFNRCMRFCLSVWVFVFTNTCPLYPRRWRNWLARALFLIFYQCK